MKRSPVAFGLLLAAASGPALADDLSLTGVLRAPVSTSKASNSSPGNIFIDITGGIEVTNTAAALTIDSNNTVDNGGVIQNAGTGSAIGVHVLGGFTGYYNNLGNIGSIVNVGGGSGDIYGLLLDGQAAFTGNISFVTQSTIVVAGPNAVGVGIKAPLTGNLDLGAATNVSGVNATGALVTAPVSGFFANRGVLFAAGTRTYTGTDIDPLSGSGMAVGAGIAGGILNTGPSTGDITTAASITNAGTAPAVNIAPSVAGAAGSSFTIGLFSDSTVANYSTIANFSFVNRGSITAQENDPGISTTGVRIGESSATPNTVTLTGGFYNSGSILASAESNNLHATTAASAPTNATAVEIGNGAILNAAGTAPAELFNDGGSITATLTGDNSGIASSILIQPGGRLSSIHNTGTIVATAFSTNTAVHGLIAYGIRDLSGTLSTITNSGSITAASTRLDDGSVNTIAIDLSRGSGHQTVTSSGTIAGDVLFGSAGASGGVAGNQFVVEGPAASFSGGAKAAGALDIHVSDQGTGGAYHTDHTEATTLSVGSGGSVLFALSKSSTPATPLVSTTGSTAIGSGATVGLAPTSFLPTAATYTLIHAAGGLTFGDFATATAAPLPFLYNGRISQTGNDLQVTLERKSAAELGLSGNEARIYEPLAAAALNDDGLGAVLLTLGSQEDVRTAVNAMIPDIAGGVRALAVALTDQATGVIGARARNLVTNEPRGTDELRFWGQEFYNNVNDHGGGGFTGFGGAGQGIALGAEWGDLDTGRIGVGYSFFASQETERHPRDTKIDGDWHLVSLYAGWRFGDAFVTPEVNAGVGDFSSRRLYVIGTPANCAAGLGVTCIERQPLGHWTSYLAAGGLMLGYIADFGTFQVVPHIAVDGLLLHQAAYDESGGGGVGLTLKSQNQDSVRTFAGVLGQGRYDWQEGKLQPQVLVGWSHEFMDSPATIDGTFEAAPGSPFHLVGPQLSANKLVGGASVAYVFGNWSAGVNYDATGSSGELAHSATISLSSRF